MSLWGSRLYEQIVEATSRIAAVLLIILGVGSLTIAFYYNNWVDWWRGAFLVISLPIGIFFGIYLNWFYQWHIRIGLLFAAGLLVLEFVLAGIIVHPGVRAYDIRSGRLELHHGSGWDWPWTQPDVTLPDPPNTIIADSVIFPERLLKIELKLAWKEGTPTSELKRREIIAFASTLEADPKNGEEELHQCVNVASQKILVRMQLSETSLEHPTKKEQQQEYLKLLAAEIPRNLPDFFANRGKVKINPVARD